MTEKSSSQANLLRIVATVAILAVGAGGLAWMVALGKPEAATVKPEARQNPLVETAPVTIQQKHLDIGVDGVVVPRREIVVAAEVGGQVIEKTDACEAGKYIRKGTLLVEIDPSDYKLEVRRLDMELAQAKVNVEELNVDKKNTQELITLAEDSLKLQQKEVARLEQLAKHKKKYVTESEMDGERRNELTARNALVTLQNQLRTIGVRRGSMEAARDLVQANLDKANLNLSRTRITSPIDGIVVRDSVELDAYLAPGTVVATIEDVSKCNVRCNLRMDDLYWVWNQPDVPGDLAQGATGRGYVLPATPATVVYTLGDWKYEWQGVLTRYDGIGLDETTRTVPCIVVVDRPNEVRRQGKPGTQQMRGPRALVRGMYVKVIIRPRLNTTLLRVPEEAIRPGERYNGLWCFRPQRTGADGDVEGRLQQVRVKVINVMDKEAVVLTVDGNLRVGDRVVTSPLVSPTENMPARRTSELKP